MKGKRYLFLSPLLVLLSIGLLWETQAVSAGVRAGLVACANVIIPSLFPFMILANIIAFSRSGAYLNKSVAGFTKNSRTAGTLRLCSAYELYRRLSSRRQDDCL